MISQRLTGLKTIIGAGYSINYPYAGLLDEVSYFNNTLSLSDITTIYNSGIPNDLSSLSPISWWRMGEEANYSGGQWKLIDQGSGGNNGTSSTIPAPPAQPSTDVPT